MFRKPGLIVLLLVMLGSLLAACGKEKEAGGDSQAPQSSQASQGKSGGEVIKIGAVLPLTGTNAYYGTTIKSGIDLYLDELNAAGGVDGHRIEVIYMDDKGTPTEAVNATQKLITQDKVTAIIGAHSSSNTLAMRDITEREKVVQLTPASGADKITEPGHPYMFRWTLYNGQQGPILAEYAIKNLNLKKIAIIAESSDFGRDGANNFKKKVEEIGGSEIAALEYYKGGDKDFYAQLTKIKGTGADGLLISGNITEGAQIAKQVKDLGMNVQLLGFASLTNDQFAQLAGDAAEGLIHIGVFEPGYYDYFPNSKKMVEAYKAKYNKNPDMQVANGYGSMQVFAEAIRIAGGGDREKFREALTKIDGFENVTGPVKFDANGQSNQLIVFEKLEKGKRVIIATSKDIK